MRIIDSIPHPVMSISIFQMNDKYIIKFEAGPMEQAFKFVTTDVGSLDQLKLLINDDFIHTVYLRFNDMFSQMKDTMKKV